jgi:hypothetical protein
MRTPLSWYLVLLVVILVVPYLAGVPPRSRRQWRYLLVTIAFLTWLLLGFASLRSA